MTKRLAALAILLLCTACSKTYHGAAIEGWVVDAQTKQPLEDVIVVVMWELDRGGFHPGQAGALFRKEAVTDNKGRFAFPEWGPMKAERGFMRDATPYIALYKRGYKTAQLRNQNYKERQPVGGVWHSEWNGETVELERYEGDLKGYDNYLQSVRFLYRWGCEWEQMPQLTADLLKLADECRAVDAFCANGPSIRKEGCSDPAAILGRKLE